MTRRALMVQGTGSDVGKSLLVAGLCRVARRRGLAVRPFKPQNMSNNAAVTADGGEIGRAQALQARACGVPPSVDMNPVLLKPQTDRGSQVVVQGRMRGTADARAYQDMKAGLLPAVRDSFARLCRQADLVLVEGAGSPAEVNLRRNDIANMGFAVAEQVPVALVADIDRGGVIAALVGTKELLTSEEAALVRGFVINRFRGDPSLFDDGLAIIRQRTGWHPFGVLPHLPLAGRLPAEDAAALSRDTGGRNAGDGRLIIAVPMLSRIANFDDFDPLAQEPGVDLRMVPPGTPLPLDAGLVILPGSKATIGDLSFLRAQGWDVDLAALVRAGVRVLGVCGGYQMLGHGIADPDGIEGPPGRVDGLGYLAVDTVLTGHKALRAVTGRHPATDAAIRGYEMHVGVTEGPDRQRPLLLLDDDQPEGDRPDGAVSADGRIAGAYVHGLFAADGFRRAYLAGLGVTGKGMADYDASVDMALDALADAMEAHLDVDGLLAAAG